MTAQAPSFLLDLSIGIADLLSGQGFGWRDRTATHPLYPARLPNVSTGGIAHAVALTCVPLTADPSRNQSETRLSFLMRSASDDISDLWAIETALANGLLGRRDLHLSTGIGITTISFRTSGALTQDDQGRWESTADYVANHGRTTTYRN